MRAHQSGSEAHRLAAVTDDKRAMRFGSGAVQNQGPSPAVFGKYGSGNSAGILLLNGDRGADGIPGSLAFIFGPWSGKTLRASGTASSDARLREALLAGPEELRLQLLAAQTPVRVGCRGRPGPWDETRTRNSRNVWPASRPLDRTRGERRCSVYSWPEDAPFPTSGRGGPRSIVRRAAIIMWPMDAKRAEETSSGILRCAIKFLIA